MSANKFQLQSYRSTTKFNIKRVIDKTNKSVDLIANRASQSLQNHSHLIHYSKKMLNSARSSPKVSKFNSRHDLFKFKSTGVLSSMKKMSKNVRYSQMNRSNTNFLTQSLSNYLENSESIKKELLFTRTTSAFGYRGNVHSKTEGYRKTNELNYQFKNEQFGLDQFLYRLYIQKVKDLKGRPNQKQQQLFVQKYRNRFMLYSQQEQKQPIKDSDLQQTFSTKIKQINVGNSGFGVNCIRWISEFMLMNKLAKQLNNIEDYVCYLKSIILDQNPIGDEGVSLLAELISHCKVLETLSIISINMSPKGARQLLNKLIGLESLKHLNLSSVQGLNRNRLSNSIQIIHQILTHPKCSISTLNLSSSNVANKGLKIISQSITSHSTLRQLILKNNEISIEQLPFFLHRVQTINLTTLNLSHNQIGDQGIKMITKTIGLPDRHNSISQTIHTLDLSSNQITSKGIESFCKTMCHNQSLTELYLANNPLSKGQQFYHFKLYISKNWTLKIIDFTHCFTKPDEMRHLFEGLQDNRSLSELKLNKNDFSQQVFIALTKMLNSNKSLKSLQLQSCNLSDRLIQKCDKQLLLAKNIQQIYLGNNFLSDKSGNILLQMINSNKSIIKLSLIKNCLKFKVQQQIQLSLKANRRKKEMTKVDDKQMEYLQYVAEIQSHHQKHIKNSIQRLQQQQAHAKLSSLLCSVIKVQLEEQQYQRQLRQQMIKIQQLQKKLNAKQ